VAVAIPKPFFDTGSSSGIVDVNEKFDRSLAKKLAR